MTEEMIRKLSFLGRVLLGTLKRCFFSPFTYGGSRVFTHQEVIPEYGHQFSKFSTQTLGKNFNKDAIQSVAGIHRTGKGTCFLTHSTFQQFGPYAWTYVYDPLAKAPRKTPFEGKYTPLGACCILLTWTQRTPDWFLLRKFQITSSIASTILQSLF